MLYYITEDDKWPPSEVIVPEHQIKKISSKIVAKLKIYTIELMDGAFITGYKITTTELINAPAGRYLLIDGNDTCCDDHDNIIFDVFNVLAFQYEFKEKQQEFENSRIINCLTDDPYLSLRNGIILDLHLRKISTPECVSKLNEENLMSYLKEYTKNESGHYDLDPEFKISEDFYGISNIKLIKSKEEQ